MTDVIRSVGNNYTPAKDYTSIAAYISDLGDTTSGDLDGDDEVAIAELYRDDSSGAGFDEQNIIDGFTSSTEANPIIFRAAAGEKYTHEDDTGVVWGGSSYVCDNREYLFVEDIHFGDPANNYTIYARSGATTIVNRCTFEFDTVSGCDSSGSTQEFNACLIIQGGTGGGGGMIRYQALDHCTYICDDTLGAIVRDSACENVLIYNANDDPTYNNFYNCTGDYNAQSVSTGAAPPAGGANIEDDVPSTDFESYVGGDYHLSGTGAQIYHEGTVTLTLDHDGIAFDVTSPSIGAFELPESGKTLTISQTESSETQSCGLDMLLQLSPSQIELIESQTAIIELVIEVAIPQIEISESQSAGIDNIIGLAAIQTEAFEAQSAQMKNLIAIAAAQLEAAEQQDSNLLSLVSTIVEQYETLETNSIGVQNVVELNAIQTEGAESQAIALGSILFANLSISQTEFSETQIANVSLIADILVGQTEDGEIQSIAVETLASLLAIQTESAEEQTVALTSVITASISASQTEASETAVLSLKAVISASMAQLETEEVQNVFVNALVALQVAQVEASDTQTALLTELIIYQALNELSVRLDAEMAVSLDPEISVTIDSDVATTVTTDKV